MNSNKSSKLGEEALAVLLDEVAAMAASGRSIGFGLTRLEHRALGPLGQAASQIRKRLADGELAEDAISTVSSNYRAPVRSAIRLLHRTGSPDAIIETGRLIRESARERQRERVTFVGSLIHLLLSVTIFFAVLPWMIVSLSETEWQTGISDGIVDLSRRVCNNMPLTLAFIAIAVVAILLAWMMVRRLLSHNGLQASAVLCRWLAVQLNASPESAGDDVSFLVSASAEAAGTSADWMPVVEAIQSGATSQQGLRFPATATEPMCKVITQLASGQVRGRAAAADLSKLASLYERQNSIRSHLWTYGLPRLLTFGVMLLLILTLMFVIVRPLGRAFEQLAL